MVAECLSIEEASLEVKLHNDGVALLDFQAVFLHHDIDGR